MAYGKLVNNKLELAPYRIVIGDKQIFNPSGVQYEELGYLPIRFVEPPEHRDGFYLVDGWEIVDEEIVQNWHYEVAPDEEDAKEILSIILGDEYVE